MSYVFFVFLSMITGYLLGSVNTSLIVGKFYNKDIRKYGSGNAGTTNTLRTLGKKATVFVIIGDVLKGVLACVFAIILSQVLGAYRDELVAVAGLAAVIGHNWPLYFNFRGGKGVLTTFAVIMMMDWLVGLILLALFLGIVTKSRYVSLGSIICAALLPLIYIYLNKSYVTIICMVLLAVIILVRHVENLRRIVAGTENKIGNNE